MPRAQRVAQNAEHDRQRPGRYVLGHPAQERAKDAAHSQEQPEHARYQAADTLRLVLPLAFLGLLSPVPARLAASFLARNVHVVLLLSKLRERAGAMYPDPSAFTTVLCVSLGRARGSQTSLVPGSPCSRSRGR